MHAQWGQSADTSQVHLQGYFFIFFSNGNFVHLRGYYSPRVEIIEFLRDACKHSVQHVFYVD